MKTLCTLTRTHFHLHEQVRSALYDLEKLGIASNDTALTAFVHAGVERSSKKRLDAVELERALIERLRMAAPDMGKGDAWPLAYAT